MTRKDTILVAVVINAGLLAILFTTAVIYDIDKGNPLMEPDSQLVENSFPADPAPSTLVAAKMTGDEVDNVLKYYNAQASNQPLVIQTEPEIVPLPNEGHPEEYKPSNDSSLSPKEEFTEVMVKKGDVLEKIARAHKTTVTAIKKANRLESEKLSIGQVLKIPASDPKIIANLSSPKEEARNVKKEQKSEEAVYYTIQSGDNPWKIARQYGIKYDEILRLNHLDEEKARNLKIGDKIRVK